jgi:hypothetical protein
MLLLSSRPYDVEFNRPPDRRCVCNTLGSDLKDDTMLITVVLPALAAPAYYSVNKRQKRLARIQARRDRENAECRANNAARVLRDADDGVTE